MDQQPTLDSTSIMYFDVKPDFVCTYLYEYVLLYTTVT